MQYIFTKVICNNPKLYLRKRLLHKGYELLKESRYDIDPVHIVYLYTKKHVEAYILNEYGVRVNL